MNLFQMEMIISVLWLLILPNVIKITSRSPESTIDYFYYAQIINGKYSFTQSTSYTTQIGIIKTKLTIVENIVYLNLLTKE